MNWQSQGFTVLDIGTNIGATLLQFSNKVGENGKVYGFEPDKINFQACKTNIELNNFSNLQVENIGLGNEKGSFRLNVDTIDNRGRNRIKFDGNDNKNTTKIQVEKLDDWISTKNIQKINLIKIDVEGFELKVLQGGEKTIKSHLPILFVELDDNNLKAVDDSAKTLVSFLKDLGYSLTNAETNEKVSQKDDFTNCHFDIIATY